MGISKRELIVVSMLLIVLTAALVYQWWFNPNTCWWKLKAQRKAWEQAWWQSQTSFEFGERFQGKERFVRHFPAHPMAASTRTLIVHTRTTLKRYEDFVCRFPKHPKAAAAWVVIAGLEEWLDCHSPRVIAARIRLRKFYGDNQAAVEVEKLLKDSYFTDIAYEMLTCIAPRRFARGQSADRVDHAFCGLLSAWNSKTGKEITLPFRPGCPPQLISGTQTWRHDLGRVAFVTKPSWRTRKYSVCWTVWVADFKAGRLRAFLPSKPLPDLKKTKKPLLVWSSDGKRLSCNGETFVVE